MTRAEAIKQIEAFRTCMIVDNAEPYVVEALNMAVEALEQEPILDKIRAEIGQLPSYVAKFAGGDFAIHIDKEKVFEVIDKYKAESEG